MNSTKLDVFLSALTAFCIAAGGAIVTVVGSQSGGTTALNKTAWILAGALGLVAAAKDVRSLLKLPPVSLAVSAPARTATLLVLLAILGSLCGCAYVRSTTRSVTTVTTNGIPVVTQKTTVTGYAMLEANQSLMTLRNQSSMSGYTNKTYAPGTYIGQLNETATNTGLTNLIKILQAVAALSAAGGL